jgi:transcription elongation factor Elf1
MVHGKDTCTVCGEFKDITAKIFSDYNILFCKQCYDNELERLGDNFNLTKFNCMRCGSAKLQKMKLGLE